MGVVKEKSNNRTSEWDMEGHIDLYESSQPAVELLNQWEGKKKVDLLDIRNGLKALLEIKLIENKREMKILWDRAYPYKWECPKCQGINSSKILQPDVIPNVKPISKVIRKGMTKCRECGEIFYLKSEEVKGSGGLNDHKQNTFREDRM